MALPSLLRTFAKATLALGLLACARDLAPPRRLVLEQVRPGEGRRLLLNEPIRLVFSTALDPLSVTRDSVSLVGESGLAAPGRWIVKDRELLFLPRPVLAPTLADGGYSPGGDYVLHLRGFPHVNGLRSLAGEPLVKTHQRRFQVTVIDGEDAPFLDESPFRSESVRLGALLGQAPKPVIEGEPLRLVCLEPLDPSTLDASQFWIDREVQRSAADEQGRETLVSERERGYSKVTARLVRNNPPGTRSQFEPCAVIELTPTRALLGEPGVSFILMSSPEVTLADFAGNRAWPRSQLSRRASFRVEPRTPSGAQSLRLEFLDREGFTSTRLPWVDGTAHWGDGRIQVHYPAAAGDGHEGAVELDGLVEEGDLHAHRLSIPAGASAELASGPGLRVLRAQGLLRVEGKLLRKDTGGSLDAVPFEETQRGTSSGSLSAFLAGAVRDDRSWTVLVAGGDIWIEGEIDVDTPLILAAGGRVRINGRVRYPDFEFFKVGEGGGIGLGKPLRPLALVLDPPINNPLAAPITLAVLSSPLPRRARETYLWRDLQVGMEQGSGGARVRFLGARQELDQTRFVDHPVQLPTDQALRLLVELQVLPGEVWDPPLVDFVSISWDDR